MPFVSLGVWRFLKNSVSQPIPQQNIPYSQVLFLFQNQMDSTGSHYCAHALMAGLVGVGEGEQGMLIVWDRGNVLRGG